MVFWAYNQPAAGEAYVFVILVPVVFQSFHLFCDELLAGMDHARMSLLGV